MADAPPPPPPAGSPVAIRITRPYETEEEYLAQELEMVSKTSITLVGAQPRPQGVVLRFELVLTKGTVLVRGEGRVVGFKPNAHRGVGGLTLRFTRIDAKSKALLDKATSLREQRRPSSKPPKEPAPPEPPPPPPPEAEAAPPPPSPKAEPAPPPPQAEAAPPPAQVPPPPISSVDIPIDLADLEPDALPPALAPSLAAVRAPAAVPAPAAASAPTAAQSPQPAAPELGDPGVPAKPPESTIDAAASPAADNPPSKLGIDVNSKLVIDVLLERLRARARGLGPGGVQRVLEQKKRNGTS